MIFLILSNIDILFAKYKLISKSYISIKVLLITNSMQIINQKKILAVALSPTRKVFVVYISSLNTKIFIHLTEVNRGTI